MCIRDRDNRYEKAKDLLQGYGKNFSISNAFDVLRSVRQEGLWATIVDVYKRQDYGEPKGF